MVLLYLVRYPSLLSSVNMRGFTTSSSRYWLILLILSSEFIIAEEFHDLDSQSLDVKADMSLQNAVAETGYDVESILDKPQQLNRPQRANSIMIRFSEIVTRQIMNHFQLHQLSLPRFPFLPPWDKQKDKADGNKVSLFSMDNAKKIGALCPPDEGSEEGVDADSVVDEMLVFCHPNSPDDTKEHNSALDDDEIQAGMIVYVLPTSEARESRDSTSTDHTGISISTYHEENQIYFDKDEPQIAASRCIVEMGKLYDSNEEVIQYALIHREFHELGNVDVHRKDFAYHPVAIQKHETFASDKAQPDWSAAEFSGGLETSIYPDMEAAQVLPTYDPGYLSDSPQIEDQQVSFRWWSWIDHFNQFFRQENADSNRDAVASHSGAIIPRSSNSHSKQSAYGSNLYETEGKSFAGGSHGEIWRARRRCPNTRVDCDDKKDYIVKRLKIELGYYILEAGLREVYFGELLAREAEASSLVTTYIDHFFREGKNGQVELWIVFDNAGPSLRSYLYTSVVDADGGGSCILD